MLLGFQTEDITVAKGAMLIYAIYRSRDKRRGPSGTDMWGQIERFARSAAKRALDVGSFVSAFKRRMACDTIAPKWMETSWVYEQDEKRQFMPEILECSPEEQRCIVEVIYRETSRLILLVRGRLEDEKPIETKLTESVETGDDSALAALIELKSQAMEV